MYPPILIAGHIAEAISTTTIDAPPPAVISNSSVAIFQRSAVSLGHGVWWDGSYFFGGVGEASGWDAVFVIINGNLLRFSHI